MSNYELKAIAKERIKGKIGTFFLIFLVIYAISLAVSLIPIIGTLVAFFFVSPGFMMGITVVYLSVYDGYDITLEQVFEGFSRFFDAFKVMFFTGIFTFLWSLLLIIPGIIKAYSYSMAMYIMAEEDIGALEAIEKSVEMMEGHKMELFMLELSFIGWFLLGIITFGISDIYAAPYFNTAKVAFYNSIK